MTQPAKPPKKRKPRNACLVCGAPAANGGPRCRACIAAGRTNAAVQNYEQTWRDLEL